MRLLVALALVPTVRAIGYAYEQKCYEFALTSESSARYDTSQNGRDVGRLEV
jgi:hypothetical protein